MSAGAVGIGSIAGKVAGRTPVGAAQAAAEAPETRGAGQWSLVGRELLRQRSTAIALGVLGLITVACIVGPWIDPWSPITSVPGIETALAPSWAHPAGTDSIGRDELLRLLMAGRISLLIGLMVAIVSAAIGGTVGIVAGYFGGRVDDVLMWIVDVFMTVPSLPLLIALSAVANSDSGPASHLLASVPTQWRMIVVMSLLGWMGISRVVRSQVVSLRHREFVEAGHALGAPDTRILVQHILPNVVSVLAVFTTLTVSTAILSESALSYLGLGVNPPTASWGNLMLDARDVFTAIAYWWETWFPALAILVTVLCINFVGDGLRDALDPSAHQR